MKAVAVNGCNLPYIASGRGAEIRGLSRCTWHSMKAPRLKADDEGYGSEKVSYQSAILAVR